MLALGGHRMVHSALNPLSRFQSDHQQYQRCHRKTDDRTDGAPCGKTADTHFRQPDLRWQTVHRNNNRADDAGGDWASNVNDQRTAKMPESVDEAEENP